MKHRYQAHRTAFLEAISDAQTQYRDNIAVALMPGKEFPIWLSDVLKAQGDIRLFKYQPFSERNLQDCEAGVLHLSKLDDLNDVNEGWSLFDESRVKHELISVDVESFSEDDLNRMSDSLKDMFKYVGVDNFTRSIGNLCESGVLQNFIAPDIANKLLQQFVTRRGFELCGSLSATECSASMWDRYGDRHRGFVMGYNFDTFAVDYSTSREGTCEYELMALLAPVFYGERFDLSFYSSAASVRDPSVPGANNMEMLYLALSLLQKSKEWEYEQEWRIITYACSSSAMAHYCKITPDSIYLGLHMQEDERKRAIEMAQRNSWQIFEMKVNHDSLDWSLAVEELGED